jgi:hypothetical protein
MGLMLYVIDINVDDGYVCKMPLMLDASKFEFILAGLK